MIPASRQAASIFSAEGGSKAIAIPQSPPPAPESFPAPPASKAIDERRSRAGVSISTPAR